MGERIAQGQTTDLFLIDQDSLERVLMARLLEPPENYPQAPVPYLLGCYGRASAELRSLGAMRDQALAEKASLVIAHTRSLT